MPAFRGHDSARKFHCDVPECSASFVKRAHLRRHEMTHTQRRDFCCPGCNRAFSRNDSMARHLRRKHPNLYRSQETTPSATTGVDRLYTGAVSSAANASATSTDFAPASGYNPMSLRSPFDTAISSPWQRRNDDQRGLPDSLGRPPASSEGYIRETGLHSPKGASSAQWRAAGPSRVPDPSFSLPVVPQNEGPRSYQGRSNPAIKNEPAAAEHIGSQSFFASTAESVDRSCSARPQNSDQSAHLYRPDWTQYPNASHGAVPAAERGTLPAINTYRFPWDRQDAPMPLANPGGSAGWIGAESSSTGANIQASEHGRRDLAPPYTAFPSDPHCAAAAPLHLDASNEADLLQSEFFCEPFFPGSQCWTDLNSFQLTDQSSERIRVEAVANHSQRCSELSLAPPGPSVSPSGRAAAAADTFFAVDYRGLCDPDTQVEPANAGEVSQVMSGLGINFSTSQSAAAGPSQSLAPREAFPQPDSAMSAAPRIPSQGEMPAPWASDRLGPNASSFQSRTPSQNQSSQTSIHLPSLTPSQNEYLGPNAFSHRRTTDRVMSSVSVAFETNPQHRAPYRLTPSLADDFAESQARSVGSLDVEAKSQDDSADGAVANFNKPHDSFSSQTAALDEEGGRKAALRCYPQHSRMLFDTQHRSSQEKGVMKSTTQDRNRVMMTVNGAGSASNIFLGVPARRTYGSTATVHDTSGVADDKVEMEIDEQPLPMDAQTRNSSSSIASSAVSSDRLEQVMDRFRAFVRLCQDHMHPSPEMLDRLTPLIPKVIHADAPFLHPKMISSPKVHSPEEAVALLSLTSLRSRDAKLKEEGYQLICFVYGLVMLSYKQTLHLEGKLQSFLNCFLLVGIHSSLQTSPDMWHKIRSSCESIVLEVLRPDSSSNFHLDRSLDCIQADALQDMAEEDLYILWLRWYKHESWKRTLLHCAVKDSQASCDFSPHRIDLSARPQGPRCQAFFAYAYEPCPDAIFTAWPPKAWAMHVVNGVSLPSSKGAKLAFQDGQPVSIAACLSEQLLRPHVARSHGQTKHPRFRSSFDFGACSHAVSSSKASHSGSDPKVEPCSAALVPFVEVADATDTSTCSSQLEAGAKAKSESNPRTEARIVSQFHMLALLEAINGAWMTDSGWYQTTAWGAAALPERLVIDCDDFDISTTSLMDLPGWRNGRTLDATKVAHALMNWSEMFSGWDDERKTGGEEATASLGLKITDDAHQSVIRWQAIFLGLCVPFRSLCFYLGTNEHAKSEARERYRNVSLLLTKWVVSPYCRRALVHAGTILTLFGAMKSASQRDRPGPATTSAVYMSLVVLVSASKLLGETVDQPRQTMTRCGIVREELVPICQVWKSMLNAGEDSSNCKGGTSSDSTDVRNDEGEKDGNEEWLQTRFWHRKFQFIGLAGILCDRRDSSETYADWRMSVSTGGEAGTSVGALRAAHLRPRWSSLSGDVRGPAARRDAIHVPHAVLGNHRRASHFQPTVSQPGPERDLLRWRLRGSQAGSNAWTETRRWILQGSTHDATFCGLAFWREEMSEEAESSASRQHSDAIPVLTRERLREVLMWVCADDPAWCYREEYTDLLLRALQRP